MSIDGKFQEFFPGTSAIVTGGAGFIGAHLTEMLVHYGVKVTVIDNLLSGNIANLSSVISKINLIHGDIRRSATFENLDKVDFVFNEAATPLLYSFRNPLDDLETNAGGTINVLNYTRRCDAKLVQVSTGSVYGNPQYIPMDENHPLNPISFYAISKLAAERYCRLFHNLYDSNVAILRYFNVYGARQRVGEETGVIPIFVSRILQNQPLTIFGDGLQSRDFLHVDDCVNATLLAASSDLSKGSIVNIGGIGVEVSILDLAHLMMKLLDVKVPIIHKEPKPGDIQRLVADSSQAGKLLGYKPKVTLETGLKSYVKYIKGHKGRF